MRFENEREKEKPPNYENQNFHSSGKGRKAEEVDSPISARLSSEISKEDVKKLEFWLRNTPSSGVPMTKLN